MRFQSVGRLLVWSVPLGLLVSCAGCPGSAGTGDDDDAGAATTGDGGGGTASSSSGASGAAASSSSGGGTSGASQAGGSSVGTSGLSGSGGGASGAASSGQGTVSSGDSSGGGGSSDSAASGGGGSSADTASSAGGPGSSSGGTASSAGGTGSSNPGTGSSSSTGGPLSSSGGTGSSSSTGGPGSSSGGTGSSSSTGGPLSSSGGTGSSSSGGFTSSGGVVGASSGAGTASSSTTSTGGLSGSSGGGIAPSSSSAAGGTASSSGGAASGSGTTSSSGGGGGSSGGTGSSGALTQPLDQFCAGNGTVGSFGTTGGAVCSGQLAEDTFRFALCACEKITINSQVDVDAFDSAAGAYGVTLADGGINIRDRGDVGMNLGPMDLAATLRVRGSAFVAGGGVRLFGQSAISRNLTAYGPATRYSSTNATVGRSAFIHGDVADGYHVIGDLTVPSGAVVNGTYGSLTRASFPDNTPCPCGPGDILDIAGLIAYTAATNDNASYPGGLDPNLWATGTGPSDVVMPCGRFYLNGIDVPTSFRMTIDGRVALMVNGDFHTGSLSITVAPGAELDLFINGDLLSDSSAAFGSEAQPSSVRAYVTGNVVANGSVTYAGNVYAPNANVEIKNSDVWGALFARNVNFAARSYVHYDSAIRSAGDACADGGVPPVPDAGTPPAPDGGTPCTGVCDPWTCNGTACLPAGGGGFQCGACRSDVDCCAPDLCDVGTGFCIAG